MPAGAASYRVSDIARAVRVHPNTVRLYERWGLLAPVPRTPAGYRQYSERHLRQMQLARTALPGPFPGGGRPVYGLVRAAARDDFQLAMRFARDYARAVAREDAAARTAYRQLMAWATGRRKGPRDNAEPTVRRRQAARTLAVTIDALRNWERNGLLSVERDASGYCRYVTADLHRAAIIRSLRRAGYSVMAMLRMFREYDRGNVPGMKRALHNPSESADIIYVSDRWLATLREHRLRARRILQQLAAMQRAARVAAAPRRRLARTTLQ